LNGVVTYNYNEYDTATSFKDANNNNTAYEYDLLNRLVSETSATGSSDSYEYDALSRLTKYVNKRGQSINYVYDAEGKMTGRRTVEDVVLYTYDANGNLLTIEDKNGTIARTYDNLNRVKSYTNANNQTIGYEYDSVGNLTKLTYPDGKKVTYTYNSMNQMTSVTDWNNRVTSYTYDNNGRLKSISRPDGSIETYTYNAIGQLTNAVDKTADGTIINEYSYVYDADGNIITENSANEPAVSAFGIDSADMGYGLANQLNSFNGMPISYDADGNMLSTPLGDKWGVLTYDSLNYLTDVTTSSGAVSYIYDAEGYRASKTEYGITTNFVVNPNAELSQVLMSTKNGETTYYVCGLGLISQENSGGYKLYHYDYRGSTTAITNLNGGVTDTVFYDPYGNIVSRTGTTETPFLYVGQYGVETDTNGLYYMRARYYNPTIQRFINVDPVRDGYNWYGYTNGNSVNHIDPLGKVFIIAWSYGGEDILAYENYLIKGGNKNVNGDKNPSEWTEEMWNDFFNKSLFYRAAMTKKDELIALGVKEEEIVFERIDNVTDLQNKWNTWETFDTVDGLYFFSHGYEGGPEVHGSSSIDDDTTFWDIAKPLNFGKTREYMPEVSDSALYVNIEPVVIFYGCNTANGNFAQNFSNDNNVTVFAQTSGSDFSYNQTIRIKPKDFEIYDKNIYLLSFDIKIKGKGVYNTDGQGKVFYPKN